MKAMVAAPSGMPGCPEFAFSTPIDRQRSDRVDAETLQVGC
jgi:hypothetical protein